jgi:hypothetical protein
MPAHILSNYAKLKGITLPPQIPAHIGSEMLQRFKANIGLGRGYSFMLFSDEQRDTFCHWLDRDGYAQAVMAAVKENAGISPQHILILDEFHCEGGTAFAASHLIQRAFPQAKLTFLLTGYLDWGCLITDTYGEKGILPLHTLARDYLHELWRGYAETETGLLPLNSLENLRRLGQQERFRRFKILDQLLSQFGEKSLLSFRQQVADEVLAAILTGENQWL